MSEQLIIYINPRLAILSVHSRHTHQNYIAAQFQIKSTHKNYFHIFNLTTYNFADSGFPSVDCTTFKWRGLPYSLTETIRILAAIENYQLQNIANAAFIAVSDELSYGFAMFVVECYYSLFSHSDRNYCKSEGALIEFQKLYKTIDVKNPPLKILESIQFQDGDKCFIPVIKIFNEGRHNSYEEIHVHDPQNELTAYYVERRKPIGTGIGSKFCQKRPQTKYLLKPVIVFGDVKFQVYSFAKLKYQREFVIGFNTKSLQIDQNIIQFQKCDFYEISNPVNLKNERSMILNFSDYCEKCKESAQCSQCLQIMKKIGNSYSIAQVELQKICRNRTKEESFKIIGV